MTIPYPNYISPEGFAKLRAEYDHLLGVERPAVVEVVSANALKPGYRAPRDSIVLLYWYEA